MRYTANVYDVEEIFTQRLKCLPTTRDIREILPLIGVDYLK